ncbi:hypothetical protein ES703_25780 [subsurface metagenome]
MPQERYLRAFAFNQIPILHPALLYDDCDGTFNWVASGDGADWVAQYDTSVPYVGTNGLLLRTRATAPAANDNVSVVKRLWLPPNHLGRVQLVVRPVTHNQDLFIQVALLWFDGVHLHTAQIRIDTNARIIRYRNAAGTWTTIFTDALESAVGAWNHLDFYADFAHQLYGYLTFNHETVDLTGVRVLTGMDATQIHLELVLWLEISGVVQGGCAFDQILLTSETL